MLLIMELIVSEKVKVRYERDGSRYTLDVEVIDIPSSGEFVGRIEGVFATGIGEVTGGEILELKGQKATFKNGDILLV
jgi:hypothetical protein